MLNSRSWLTIYDDHYVGRVEQRGHPFKEQISKPKMSKQLEKKTPRDQVESSSNIEF
jgi:hypothetical protein